MRPIPQMWRSVTARSWSHLVTMSTATTVDIDPSLLKSLRDFRLSKRSSKNAALVAKIDKKKLLLEEEELLDPITPDDLAEELPEHSPRFVVLSYELRHSDGRISYVRTRQLTQ